MSGQKHVSRRELFSRFLRPVGRTVSERDEEPSSAPKVDPGRPRKAVIQGRHCIAYIPAHCTRCHDECPEQGAIVVDDGFPRVVWEHCTGCAICHEVCPAETNAILLINPPMQSR